MRYAFDHDYHIHSYLSSCSKDPEQTAERILAYAEENGLKSICVTDHLWDKAVPGASGWYMKQNIEHVSAVKNDEAQSSYRNKLKDIAFRTGQVRSCRLYVLFAYGKIRARKLSLATDSVKLNFSLRHNRHHA